VSRADSSAGRELIISKDRDCKVGARGTEHMSTQPAEDSDEDQVKMDDACSSNGGSKLSVKYVDGETSWKVAIWKNEDEMG
jgi:hypothetical protein